jgi:hypothetical protein
VPAEAFFSGFTIFLATLKSRTVDDRAAPFESNVRLLMISIVYKSSAASSHVKVGLLGGLYDPTRNRGRVCIKFLRCISALDLFALTAQLH